jgi:succinoglycan biosynthesis protein ExoV
MKLSYWRGEIPNFGDELNPWLWERLLPGVLDDDGSELFLAIGSILWDDLPRGVTKVIFGSGYAGYTRRPQIDDSWSIYFLRGARSADMIGADRSLALGDPATLVRVVARDLPSPQPGRIGFMPHWESAADGNWEPVARAAGLSFIDPRWSVDRVLAEIRSCELLVSEAMHGAVVADALRVRWVPFAPLVRHHFKWYDWADTLGVTFEFAPSLRSSLLELALAEFGHDKRTARRLRKYGRSLRTLGSALVRPAAVEALRHAAEMPSYLSSDETIERLTSALLDQVERFRCDREAIATTREARARPDPSHESRSLAQ